MLKRFRKSHQRNPKKIRDSLITRGIGEIQDAKDMEGAVVLVRSAFVGEGVATSSALLTYVISVKLHVTTVLAR
jgi:hypothetical protein